MGARGRHTLHFPCFPLLVLGDLFHVFVINVVLAHKTVDPSVQQVDGWEWESAEVDSFDQFVRSV